MPVVLWTPDLSDWARKGLGKNLYQQNFYKPCFHFQIFHSTVLVLFPPISIFSIVYCTVKKPISMKKLSPTVEMKLVGWYSILSPKGSIQGFSSDPCSIRRDSNCPSHCFDNSLHEPLICAVSQSQAVQSGSLHTVPSYTSILIDAHQRYNLC